MILALTPSNRQTFNEFHIFNLNLRVVKSRSHFLKTCPGSDKILLLSAVRAGLDACKKLSIFEFGADSAFVAAYTASSLSCHGNCVSQLQVWGKYAALSLSATFVSYSRSFSTFYHNAFLHLSAPLLSTFGRLGLNTALHSRNFSSLSSLFRSFFSLPFRLTCSKCLSCFRFGQWSFYKPVWGQPVCQLKKKERKGS